MFSTPELAILNIDFEKKSNPDVFYTGTRNSKHRFRRKFRIPMFSAPELAILNIDF